MAGQREQEKQRTRARISDAATALFQQHGFDRVTVNQVAAAAGVSKVTVFAHFPRKEDLFLDRAPEAADLVRHAVRSRAPEVGTVRALHELADRLARQRHPLSGLNPGSAVFVATLADSPALQSRARELAAELETVIADEARALPGACADPDLVAALIVAALRTVVTATVGHLLSGRAAVGLLADHRRRLRVGFDAVQSAVDTLTTEDPGRGISGN